MSDRNVSKNFLDYNNDFRISLLVQNMPVKHWSHYCFDEEMEKILPPSYLSDMNRAYQDFCNSIKKSVKKALDGWAHGYNVLELLLMTASEAGYGLSEIVLFSNRF